MQGEKLSTKLQRSKRIRHLRIMDDACQLLSCGPNYDLIKSAHEAVGNQTLKDTDERYVTAIIMARRVLREHKKSAAH